MITYETKKDAFEAWQNSKCDDRQLAVVVTALTDFLATMRAMGERGYHQGGYVMALQSAEMAQDARKREKQRQEKFAGRIWT